MLEILSWNGELLSQQEFILQYFVQTYLSIHMKKNLYEKYIRDTVSEVWTLHI